MTKHSAHVPVLLACLLVLAVPAWPADTIAAWDFDSQGTAPTTGSGTAVLIGGVANYGTGWAAGNLNVGYAWNTSTFPEQGAGNRTAGIQFSVSTFGYAGINVSFDRRSSSTASRYLRFQFSTDGGATWDDGAMGSLTLVFDILFHTSSFDLGAFPSAADNPNFSCRVVAEFDPSFSQYTGATSGYAGTGSIRWDNLTVTGTPLPPLGVAVEQASGQSDPTSLLPVNFTVVFSEPVSDFTADDVTISGTAGGTKTVSLTGSGTTYTAAVSGATSSGTIVASIAAGAAQNGSGHPNLASTSADHTVDYVDTPPPSVTIDQAAGQSDPTYFLPVNFTVVFSEPVSDFTAEDVAISGTAGGTKTVNLTGSGTTYNAAVSGITSSGTIVASIAAGAAHSGSGHPNFASTSSDNTVNYILDTTAPSVTIDQAAGQRDPTNNRWVNFTAVFNEPVDDFTAGDVVVSGTAGGYRVVSVTGTGTTYNVAVSYVTSPGTVVVSIPAGVAHCGAANPNSASTSIDNSINVFRIGPLAMTNRSVGEGCGPSTVGLWVRISGIVSNLGWGSCDIDDGSGPVHVALGSASVIGPNTPIADGKFVTVSGQVSSSSPRSITCSTGDAVLVY